MNEIIFDVLFEHGPGDLLSCRCGWGPPQRNVADLARHRTDAIIEALTGSGAVSKRYRCLDLVSGGGYLTDSLEEVERHCIAFGSHKPDLFDLQPHPKQHQQAKHIVWPDGSEYTGPWEPVFTDQFPEIVECSDHDS